MGELPRQGDLADALERAQLRSNEAGAAHDLARSVGLDPAVVFGVAAGTRAQLALKYTDPPTPTARENAIAADLLTVGIVIGLELRAAETVGDDDPGARSRLYSEVLDVIASSADRTGLRAGPAAEQLVDALVERVLELDGARLG